MNSTIARTSTYPDTRPARCPSRDFPFLVWAKLDSTGYRFVAITALPEDQDDGCQGGIAYLISYNGKQAAYSYERVMRLAGVL